MRRRGRLDTTTAQRPCRDPPAPANKVKQFLTPCSPLDRCSPPLEPGGCGRGGGSEEAAGPALCRSADDSPHAEGPGMRTVVRTPARLPPQGEEPPAGADLHRCTPVRSDLPTKTASNWNRTLG